MKIIQFLVVGIISLVAATANAAQILEATDGDVNIMAQGFNNANYSLYMFDDSYAMSPPPLVANAGLLISLTDSFIPPLTSIQTGFVTIDSAGGNDFSALDQGLGSGITLDNGARFILALLDSSGGGSWTYGTFGGFSQDQQVAINFGGVAGSLVIDVKPVPLPAAAWLFASALVGFVGVARRNKV